MNWKYNDSYNFDLLELDIQMEILEKYYPIGMMIKFKESSELVNDFKGGMFIINDYILCKDTFNLNKSGVLVPRNWYNLSLLCGSTHVCHVEPVLSILREDKLIGLGL